MCVRVFVRASESSFRREARRIGAVKKKEGEEWEEQEDDRGAGAVC